jgi:hypothetical protein
MTLRVDDEERLVVGVRRAEIMLDCGHTHLYELPRKITVASIRAYVARRLAQAEKSRGASRSVELGAATGTNGEPLPSGSEGPRRSSQTRVRSGTSTRSRG